MLRDLKNNVKVVQSIAPAVGTGTVNGDAVATQGYNSVTVVVGVGVLGGGAVSFKLQESTDGSTNWGDIEAARLIGAFAAGVAATPQIVGISEIGALTKSHVRVVATVVGGTGVGMSAHFILGEPKSVPVGSSESVYIA